MIWAKSCHNSQKDISLLNLINLKTDSIIFKEQLPFFQVAALFHHS